MKFIIYISSRLRHGEYPKLPEFPFSQEHGKYIYKGKELEADEFNEAAKRVFHIDYRANGYSFRPEAIPQPQSTERFRLDGTDIFEGDERVGGLFQPGPHLRVATGKSDLRADLEAFLTSIQSPSQ